MTEAKRQRLPRNRRVSTAPAMRLTDRDTEIIKTVHDWRVMRGDQIQALFFGSQSTASYRLSRLYQHGFLDRHFLPTVGGLASSPILYTLGRRGLDVLRQQLGYGPEEVRRRLGKRELSPLFMEHLLQINDVRLAVTLAARANNYTLDEWHDDARLKADYDRVSIETARRRIDVSLIPDAYFVLQVPQGRACCFLELDRGTMTVSRFRSKVQAYKAYIDSGEYYRRYQTRSLRILTVTPGEKRRTNLREEAEAVGGGRVFWFTTINLISSRTVVDGAIWSTAGGGEQQVLIEK